MDKPSEMVAKMIEGQELTPIPPPRSRRRDTVIEILGHVNQVNEYYEATMEDPESTSQDKADAQYWLAWKYIEFARHWKTIEALLRG